MNVFLMTLAVIVGAALWWFVGLITVGILIHLCMMSSSSQRGFEYEKAPRAVVIFLGPISFLIFAIVVIVVLVVETLQGFYRRITSWFFSGFGGE